MNLTEVEGAALMASTWLRIVTSHGIFTTLFLNLGFNKMQGIS
jgi:hypothetical protein